MYAQIFVPMMSIISMLLAISTLIAPMVASFLLAFRWKKLSLEGLCDDIRHEQAMADRLAKYESVALKDAHFWLSRIIRRISERTGRFFGEKTAVIGLLATAYSFTAEFGGVEWISKTMAAGFRADNLGNTLLLGAGALLLGMSIGSILLPSSLSKVQTQMDLLTPPCTQPATNWPLSLVFSSGQPVITEMAKMDRATVILLIKSVSINVIPSHSRWRRPRSVR